MKSLLRFYATNEVASYGRSLHLAYLKFPSTTTFNLFVVFSIHVVWVLRIFHSHLGVDSDNMQLSRLRNNQVCNLKGIN